MRKRYFLLTLLSLFLSSSVCNIAAQEAPCLENNFSRPAGAVFDQISKLFGVEIKRSKSLNSVMISDADYLICPWSEEETMDAVCARIGKVAYKNGQGIYEVRDNDHTRTSPKNGKKLLDYLSSRYSTRQEWEARRDTLRREFARHLGFETIPQMVSKPVLSGKRSYDDIYIENITIEVLPGVYCTGTVYHPKKYSKGSCPIVVNPLGHFGDGRFGDQSQMLCQMLAKMGCIALSYDMFAWQGSDQALQYSVADGVHDVHRHAVAQNIQILYGLKALDYLYSLKEADKSRVGVTGASGGGSQTMYLTALDDRITVSMPVVMTSCYMNGGCPCESGNAVQLICGRTCNTEIAALAAPRPMLLVSDGHDWTDHCPDYDMPYLKKVYGFYGCPQNVENAHFPEERHDYGFNKRCAVYEFISRIWGLNTKSVKAADGRFDESGCVSEEVPLLLNWGADEKRLPSNAVRTIEEVQAAWDNR